MLGFGFKEAQEEVEEVIVPSASIKMIEQNNLYGKFAVEPLPQGYGITLGNPMRRVLLAAIPGVAITWVKIEGIQHEYQSIPHVREDVSQILLNIRSIRLKSLTERSGKLRLEVSGEGVVSAGDIATSSDFEIANPELYIASLDSPKASLIVEMNVDKGTGYIPAAKEEGLPIAVLPVDALFTPVRKVKYYVEDTRIGQFTNFDRLVLEVWTDGSITPLEAVKTASKVLVDYFLMVSAVTQEVILGDQVANVVGQMPADHYDYKVENLSLSARTLNCLKREKLNRLGEVFEKTQQELLKLKNFGNKSFDELVDQIVTQGFWWTDSPLAQSLKKPITIDSAEPVTIDSAEPVDEVVEETNGD